MSFEVGSKARVLRRLNQHKRRYEHDIKKISFEPDMGWMIDFGDHCTLNLSVNENGEIQEEWIR